MGRGGLGWRRPVLWAREGAGYPLPHSVPAFPCPVLGKAVHALSRIGDELYVEPTENGVSGAC